MYVMLFNNAREGGFIKQMMISSLSMDTGIIVYFVCMVSRVHCCILHMIYLFLAINNFGCGEKGERFHEPGGISVSIIIYCTLKSI